MSTRELSFCFWPPGGLLSAKHPTLYRTCGSFSPRGKSNKTLPCLLEYIWKFFFMINNTIQSDLSLAFKKKKKKQQINTTNKIFWFSSKSYLTFARTSNFYSNLINKINFFSILCLFYISLLLFCCCFLKTNFFKSMILKSFAVMTFFIEKKRKKISSVNPINLFK